MNPRSAYSALPAAVAGSTVRTVLADHGYAGQTCPAFRDQRRRDLGMPHRNAPLTVEGRRRLIERCRTRPIADVAAEMGISRACASKWVNRWRRHGDLGLPDRSSIPHNNPRATPAWVIEKIESWQRQEKWSAQRITHELADHRSPAGTHAPPGRQEQALHTSPQRESGAVPAHLVRRAPVRPLVHQRARPCSRD